MEATITKFALLMLILLTLGCNHNGRNPNFDKSIKYIKLRDRYLSEKEIYDTLKKLARKENFIKANKLADSLILTNKENGFLYFARGNLRCREFKFISAISDFRVAQDLNYDKDKCQKFIDYCNTMLNLNYRIVNRPLEL